MKTLFVNACIREDSRTLTLARDVMDKSGLQPEELKLEALGLSPIGREDIEKRFMLHEGEGFDDPSFALARQFAIAEHITVAAPFWDLGIPALLKLYLEHITVAGITFCYKNGAPTGLCRAKQLVFVTTSGGPVFADFGYPYVKTLAKSFYGIEDTVCYRAEGLDVLQIRSDELIEKCEIIRII